MKRFLVAARTLVECTHPAPSFGISAMVAALAISAGLGPRVLLVAVAVLSGQFSLGWANDYLDRERDRASGRRDKPLARMDIDPAVVGRASVVGLLAALALSAPLGLAPLALHAFGLGMGHLYNVRLKSSLLSPLPFAAGFTVIPGFISLAATGNRWPPVAVTTAAAAIGAGAHFVNALRDMDDDAATGVRGFPHTVGPTASAFAGAGLLAAGGVLGALGARPADATVLLALAVDVVVCAAIVAAALVGRRWLAHQLSFVAAFAAVLTVILGRSLSG